MALSCNLYKIPKDWVMKTHPQELILLKSSHHNFSTLYDPSKDLNTFSFSMQLTEIMLKFFKKEISIVISVSRNNWLIMEVSNLTFHFYKSSNLVHLLQANSKLLSINICYLSKVFFLTKPNLLNKHTKYTSSKYWPTFLIKLRCKVSIWILSVH